MFEILFAITAPVFITAAIGYGWARTGRNYDTNMVTTLITGIGVPALVFSALVSVDVDLSQLGQMALASFSVVMATGLIGVVILKLLGCNLRAFLPAVAFPNTGNMGLPLSMLAFGEEGMAFAITHFAVTVIFQFTAGVMVSSGSKSVSGLGRIPALYAIGFAVTFLLLDIETPKWAMNTVEMLGGFTVPLMLITLGISLAKLHVTTMGKSAFLSVLRLILGFGIGLGIAEAMGLEGAMRGVLILQSSLPVAVFNYLFAQRYETEPEAVAGAVVISTLASFATLPFLLWWLL